MFLFLIVTPFLVVPGELTKAPTLLTETHFTRTCEHSCGRLSPLASHPWQGCACHLWGICGQTASLSRVTWTRATLLAGADVCCPVRSRQTDRLRVTLSSAPSFRASPELTRLSARTQDHRPPRKPTVTRNDMVLRQRTHEEEPDSFSRLPGQLDLLYQSRLSVQFSTVQNEDHYTQPGGPLGVGISHTPVRPT